MSLTEYAEKRDFKKTSEPKAGKSKDKDHLIFVVQKHDASRLHYDFRLEMEGVLKSWAVPKGPSLDPKIKHLAMMVEDHPFDYLNFEGIIPKGEYGGGTVIVWDEGTYEPIEPIKGKKAQEKHLLKQLASGQLKIKLHGEKLNGEFALVKTHGMGENGWLMIKHKDEFATDKDITKKDRSVLSGKTIDEMAKSSEKVWQNGHEEDVVPDEDLAEEVEAEEAPEIDTQTILKSAPKAKVPAKLKPMKATLVDEPFNEPGWLYEVKWDGYRAIANIQKDDVTLISRNNLPFEKYYPINDALKQWNMNAVLDGELLVLNEKGISDFGAMQNWRSEADGNLVFYIFDILWYEGKNLMGLPLIERQAILRSILPTDNEHIRQSKVFDANGIEFFAAAERMGLEGIIAKKADSVYTSDLRSKEWLKVKVQRRQEVVIAGYTKNEGTGKSFSALILGVYDNKGDLQFVGKVGTGFSDKLQKEMMAQFKPLITGNSPFDYEVDVDKPTRFRPKRMSAKPTWLKPELVCEVGFAEVTSDGVFRQASFKGMRTDKHAKDVVLEKAAHTEETVAEAKDAAKPAEKETTKASSKRSTASSKKTDLKLQPVKNMERKTLVNPTEDTQTKKVCGHDLKFNHVTKLYWPEDKLTKGDMLNYYYKVGEYMMPYLKDRPMSLNRFPGGIHGQSFYQKNVTDKAPDWAKTFDHVTDEGKVTKYLVGTDEASLLWMNSLGCIEINPWFSRAQTPDNPDYCVIDLDPDKHTYDQVVEAARLVKDILDAIDVPSYPKTSGSTGMHIYIPLGGKYSYQQSQIFANIVVKHVHEQIPDYTSLERSIAARKGKMYLDYLQNRPGATIAGPYSLRPKPGATVSMPLSWDEVKPGLTIQHFNIHNALDRLKETGDLFNGVLDEGIDLEKTLKKAQATLK
ncbi:DNA ligase D [Mucilaginibacter myungsuensis]|uniref:DNA ligase (ATP) n=1 Tax=Mucilaginibacter myungsuensis TaxID=649104 RepID=A0A929L069_9SPHI|nr:DNA ligase D [Mucilaginibacter myungsuensis]MBE9663188.1 DNA ligase D [Mucilaginibacter myungsuensis]MDN3598823.1 DNA ligase D [Mucilaginibacter myungsuensis]